MRAAYASAALLFVALGVSVALVDAPILVRVLATLPDAIGAVLGAAASLTLGARRRLRSL